MLSDTARRGRLLYVVLAFLGLGVPPAAMKGPQCTSKGYFSRWAVAARVAVLVPTLVLAWLIWQR